MSVMNIGQLGLSEINADPSNPKDGDMFYASSTHATRDEGVYIRENGAWVDMTTSGGGVPSPVTAYTPVTQGFGTPTLVQAFYQQIGSAIMIFGSLDTGTVTGSEVQIGLPNSWSILADITQINVMGEVHRNLSTTTDIRCLITGGDTYLNVAQDNIGFKNPQTGSTIFASTESITFNSGLIPIEELKNSSIGGANPDLTQTKILSSTITTTGVVSDLTFNNLVIDKMYSVLGQISRLVVSGGGGPIGVIKNGTTEVAGFQYDASSSGVGSTDTGICTIFKADSSTLTLEMTTCSSIYQLEGDGTRGDNGTFICLTELNNTEETTKYNA